MNIKLMKQICKTTQSQLLNIMNQFLIDRYGKDKVLATKEYIIVRGTDPVALVAHLDTVSSYPPTDIYYDNKEQVMWSPDLLGADDRAGIYAIIQLIEKGYKPHIILTTDEEKGCLGSKQFIKDFPYSPFEKLKILIQLDRCGAKDSVFYDCDNKGFERYINRFGFKTAIGTFSDISVIAPEWGVAAVNLSVGYYLEHSNAEYLKCKELDATIKKVSKILDKAEQMKFYKYIPRKYTYNNNIVLNDFQCCICGKIVQFNDAVITPDYNITCKECYDMCYNVGADFKIV